MQGKCQVFDGRYDAASVCALLATLDESDLRSLRDQLHSVLPEQVPAAGGRPLIRRKSGSSSRLVEDCWALGSSAAQGMLTRFADSQTLRAAERFSQSEPAVLTASSSTDLSVVRSSIEALLATQRRLEREVVTLRDHNRVQDRRLEELSRELELVRSGAPETEKSSAADLGPVNAEPRADTPDAVRAPSVPVTGGAATVLEAAVHPDCAAVPRPPVTARTPLPPPGCIGTFTERVVTSQERRSPGSDVHPAFPAEHAELNQRSLAQDIAASLDLRSLGVAIASAMQSQAGDSGSEEDEWPALSCSAPGGRGQTLPLRRAGKDNSSAVPFTAAVEPGARSEPAMRPAQDHSAGVGGGPSALAGRSPPITGSGAPSELVAAAAARYQAPRATYVLEGFAHDATDSQVRNMVRPLVQQLHDFRRLSRHAGAKNGLKAYRIQVDPADDPWIMNPVNWPAGLRVRPWTVKQQQEPFLAGQPSHQYLRHPSSRSGDRDQRSAGSYGSTRVWFNRNAAL